jgi:hypothetical protein
MINVYPIGTKVKLEKDVPGTITAILIEPGYNVQYKICWWNGRERKYEWLFDTIDFEPERFTTKEIGFRE